MAFTPNGAPGAQNQQSERWKAKGFLNFYLPTKEGGRRKVGAIPLRIANANEAKLADWLAAGDDNVQAFANKVMVDYNPAEPGDNTAFDLDSLTMKSESPADGSGDGAPSAK